MMDLTERRKFWENHINRKNDPTQVIVNGMLYYFSHGMHQLNQTLTVIEFFDGRLIETYNLYQVGRIPNSFRNLLPDNASFVHPKLTA